MSKYYTVEDLVENKSIYLNKLKTDVLQQFYSQHIVSNAYIFNLSNNDVINLVFAQEQFCHLIGFHYLGFKGFSGWNALLSNPKRVTDFSNERNFKLLQYRIANFNQLLNLLNNPDIYIYKATEYPEFSYSSKYFAVLNDNNRVFKLGIASANDTIHYPETFLIDMDAQKYNYYLKSENKLSIINKEILSKDAFFTQRSKNKII